MVDRRSRGSGDEIESEARTSGAQVGDRVERVGRRRIGVARRDAEAATRRQREQRRARGACECERIVENEVDAVRECIARVVLVDRAGDPILVEAKDRVVDGRAGVEAIKKPRALRVARLRDTDEHLAGARRGRLHRGEPAIIVRVIHHARIGEARALGHSDDRRPESRRAQRREHCAGGLIEDAVVVVAALHDLRQAHGTTDVRRDHDVARVRHRDVVEADEAVRRSRRCREW